MIIFIIGSSISEFDFDPLGNLVATIDEAGVCLISDINTNSYISHVKMSSVFGLSGEFS